MLIHMQSSERWSLIYAVIMWGVIHGAIVEVHVCAP